MNRRNMTLTHLYDKDGEAYLMDTKTHDTYTIYLERLNWDRWLNWIGYSNESNDNKTEMIDIESYNNGDIDIYFLANSSEMKPVSNLEMSTWFIHSLDGLCKIKKIGWLDGYSARDITYRMLGEKTFKRYIFKNNALIQMYPSIAKLNLKIYDKKTVVKGDHEVNVKKEHDPCFDSKKITLTYLYAKGNTAYLMDMEAHEYYTYFLDLLNFRVGTELKKGDTIDIEGYYSNGIDIYFLANSSEMKPASYISSSCWIIHPKDGLSSVWDVKLFRGDKPDVTYRPFGTGSNKRFIFDKDALIPIYSYDNNLNFDVCDNKADEKPDDEQDICLYPEELALTYLYEEYDTTYFMDLNTFSLYALPVYQAKDRLKLKEDDLIGIDHYRTGNYNLYFQNSSRTSKNIFDLCIGDYFIDVRHYFSDTEDGLCRVKEISWGEDAGGHERGRIYVTFEIFKSGLWGNLALDKTEIIKFRTIVDNNAYVYTYTHEPIDLKLYAGYKDVKIVKNGLDIYYDPEKLEFTYLYNADGNIYLLNEKTDKVFYVAFDEFQKRFEDPLELDGLEANIYFVIDHYCVNDKHIYFLESNHEFWEAGYLCPGLCFVHPEYGLCKIESVQGYIFKKYIPDMTKSSITYKDMTYGFTHDIKFDLDDHISVYKEKPLDLKLSI